jgi:hypothetical protein
MILIRKGGISPNSFHPLVFAMDMHYLLCGTNTISSTLRINPRSQMIDKNLILEVTEAVALL